MEAALPEYKKRPGFTCSEEPHGVPCSDRGVHGGAPEVRRTDCKSDWKMVSAEVYLHFTVVWYLNSRHGVI